MGASPITSELPPQAPRAHSRFFRALARLLLRLGGWRQVGQFPDYPRLVVIAAPHSSAWDAYWALLLKVALGMRVGFMAKREAFWFPLGALLSWLGGIPINRRNANGVVGQAVDAIRQNERMWLALAPEGTRRRVERWKTGFWQIAKRAEVPVCPVYFHYPERVIGVGPLFTLTDDCDADVERIREWYRPYVGKNRGVF